MQKNSENKKSSIAWAIAFIGFFLLILASILFPILNTGATDWLTGGILLIYILIILASVFGIAFALYQRLKEIKGGEMDEAKKY